jgi:hypothetical protein
MARKKKTPKPTPTTKREREYREPEYIEPSWIACENQAYRIGVVADFIRNVNCELLSSAACACQQQIGHVHSRDDHHEDHQGKHDPSTQRIRSKLMLFRPGETLRQNSDRHIRVRIGVLTR